MKVCEIFVSIQGESTYAGLPCVFVRMTGCNLRCAYCDTTYAYSKGLEMSEDEIFESVSSYRVRLVEITGGEPLTQKGVLMLIERFLNNRFVLLLETNGSMSIKDVDKRAVIIMDVKTPRSGMSAEMDLLNLKYLKADDEVKFVVVDREDFEWARSFIVDYELLDKCKVLLSPAYGILPPEDLSKWIIDERLPVRLNLQIQKYIYGSNRRGV
ncbi:radical SAM protein [Thermodesulfovibrionales bacterium]|nr:radical SAM protein [Thermodesulfovibrionales bacterium]MCL0107009.1 radical SAM protein [Thermodesulfovibrionales bacterium]